MTLLVRTILMSAMCMVSITTFAQGSSTAFSFKSLSPEQHQASAADLAVNSRGEIGILWVDRSPTLAAAEAMKQSGGSADHASHGQGHAGHSGPPASLDRHIALTDLFFAVSVDGGETFSQPIKVNTETGVVWGQAVSRPRLVGGAEGHWHISYAANEMHPRLGKTALTTHYVRSLDGGKTFAAPRRLSALTEQDLSSVIHGGFVSAAAFGSLVATTGNSITAVWIDTRHMDATSNSGSLYINRSKDGGETFAGEEQVLDTGVCPCCQIMAIDGGGDQVLVGSRAVDSDNYRAATVMRLGGVGHKSARSDIGAAPWQIEGCPLKPTVLARHDRNIFAAVHSGGEEKPGVIFSVSSDDGVSFASQGLVHPEADVSDAPGIATNGRSVIVVWHAKAAGPWRVHYRFFDMQGKPIESVTAIETAARGDRAPVVVARADGDYQLAWQQDGRIMTQRLAAPE